MAPDAPAPAAAPGPGDAPRPGRRAPWGGVAVAAAVLVLGGALLQQHEIAEERGRRRAILERADLAARAIEDDLSRSLAAAHALAALVRHTDLDRFEQVADDLLAHYGGISSLQLAPGGVLTRIHPLAGNEAALGLDLLADPGHRASAERTIESRQLTAEGPFELRQGGQGVVGRIAVFRPAPGGGEAFWGFVAVAVRLPDVVSRTRVAALSAAGLDWALRRDGAAQPFASSGGALPRGAVAVKVRLPGEAWELDVAPREGWVRWGGLVMPAALLVLVAGASGLLAHRLLRLPEELRRAVDERTAALALANRRLAAELVERQRAEEARQAAEAQARHGQKMEAVGLLAGGIAHDFNNLLTGILGYAELLGEPGTAADEAAAGIRQAARRGAALTRQLLGFARRGKYQQVPVDLHALVREVSALLERTLDKRIAIRHQLAAGTAVVRGDPDQLQQVVLNLAVNARDAMPSGGTLTFETAEVELDAEATRARPGLAPGRHVAITVADTGVGIPAAVRERVFDPFFTTKPAGQGTGMGLAMVYGIVQNHGGWVGFESEEGKGARFTVLLPESPAIERDDGAVAAGAPEHGAGRVLVADDERGVRETTARLLRRLGYDALPAASLAEALEVQGRGALDLALVDLAMPAGDGPETLRALRRAQPELPAVLMTGYGLDARVREALQGGFRGILHKPFSVEELAAEVARAVRRRGA
ncbi:blue-light-activated protein [Anaeromyxobacter sp. PSR-1]|nr:blue-light-activated protein [Anaeromyxobacter sp. PSR-1]